MAYCTAAQIIQGRETEMRQLCPDGAGGIDLARFDQPIDIATRTINRYLPGRAISPDDVLDIAVKVARFELYSAGRPPHVKEDYDTAIANLKAMAKGEQALADTTGAVVPPPALTVAVQQAPGALFDGKGLF